MKELAPDGRPVDEWRDGPPPHVGWWNSSRGQATDFWRWWDGEGWSYAFASDTSMQSIAVALDRAFVQEDLLWTYRYPKNARVPRIDPRETA